MTAAPWYALALFLLLVALVLWARGAWARRRPPLPPAPPTVVRVHAVIEVRAPEGRRPTPEEVGKTVSLAKRAEFDALLEQERTNKGDRRA